MKKCIMPLICLLLISSSVWRYTSEKYSISMDYKFENNKVHLLDNEIWYEYPRTLNCWAYYNKSGAVMYQKIPDSWGFMITDFRKKTAIQIGMIWLISYQIQYTIEQI